MSKKLREFSYSHKPQFYTDEKVIRNQELVKETIGYFTIGPGTKVFKPDVFMNLLKRQYDLLSSNWHDKQFVKQELDRLPLNPNERHVLYGFLLKWYGGYPIQSMIDEDQKAVLKMIESEFLEFPESTPEKDFCKADITERHLMQKLGLAFTTAINYNINVADILKSIDQKITGTPEYKSFDDLFDTFYSEGHFGNIENQQLYLIERTNQQFNFNVWLQENRNYEYGNEKQYKDLLTKDNFTAYLIFADGERQRIKFVSTTPLNAFSIYNERFNDLRKKFRVKRISNEEDCKVMPRLKPGDVIEFEPEYTNTLEAFTLLKEYYAKAYEELEKYKFIETYKVWNKETVAAEIVEIDVFISEAMKISLADACKSYNTFDGGNSYHVYRRFSGGFYENLEVSKYPLISAIGNIEAIVYGRYFLFYGFLKEKLQSFTGGLLHDVQEVKNVLEIQFLNEADLRERIENKIGTIVDIHDKIQYLRNEKENYLRQLNDETFAASGLVTAKFNQKIELFLDKWIESKISELTNEQMTGEEVQENDFIKSTIEDWLYPFIANISEGDYCRLVMCLETYFKTGIFPPDKKIIRVKGRVNKKAFGWSLNQIYRAIIKEPLTYEYLHFAKENISIFSQVELSESGLFTSNLYKYFTTKTQ